MLIDVFIIQSLWCGKPKVILKLCKWCNFIKNLHLLNHNLPFCSVRCDRALNRWMNENSYLKCCLSCKLLKFGATLASVTGENYLVLEDPVKALKCILKSVKLGYHCCILVPGGHCRLRLKMFCPGFPQCLLKELIWCRFFGFMHARCFLCSGWTEMANLPHVIEINFLL